jgi:O-antigen ligase
VRAQPQSGVAERTAGFLLCLFVFTLPLEKILTVPGVGTISRLVGIVAFAAGAMAALRRGSVRPPNLALAIAVVFVSWIGLSYFWSLTPQETALMFFTFVQLCAMAWLIWDLCRSSRLQTLLLQAYVAGTAAAAVNAFARYAQNQESYYQRYAAAGFEPNDFGVTVALSIPIGLYLAGRASGLSVWAYRAAVVLAIGAVYLTGSRTSLIATLIAFSYVPVTWRAARKSQRISNVVLVGLLVCGYFFVAPSRSRERLATIPVELTTGTLHNRTTIWKSGLRVWIERPILGLGAGAYPEAVRPELGVPQLPGHRYVAHNTFISVLVECGVVGLGIFGLMLGVLAVYTWMMPPPVRALWAVMLAVWVAGVSTLTWEHRKPGWVFFALIMTEWARSFWPADEQS